MFDLLKKKLGSFINRIVSKEEQKAAEAPEAKAETKAEAKAAAPVEIIEPVKPIEPAAETKPEPEARAPTPTVSIPAPEKTKPAPTPVQAQAPAPAEKEPEEPRRPEPKERPEAEQRKFAPKLGIITRLKSIVSPEITIREEEASPVWSELELALLESDVSLATTEHLIASMKSKIIGKRVARDRIRDVIREEIASSLKEVLSKQAPDLTSIIKAKKSQGLPMVMLFVGPNGMGKTTAIARLAARLKGQGHSIVLAAADCFRAAAVEQLKEHADKLGVSLISRGYGVDPTSVAFDAVAHAKSKGIDVVLVDTAGRQETSESLIREMEKMSRVLKPDLKVFVAEAIAGKSVVEQVKKFDKTVGLNGIILTKLDCDAKGGGALSIVYETGLPIMFLGVGQEYDDLLAFDADWIVKNVIAS
jgi:fused signal recognition particle receptor